MHILTDRYVFPPFPRLGLDPKLLTKILNMSSGRCWSSDTYNPVPGVMEGVPSANNYQGGFGTTLMAKVTPAICRLYRLWLFLYMVFNPWLRLTDLIPDPFRQKQQIHTFDKWEAANSLDTVTAPICNWNH